MKAKMCSLISIEEITFLKEMDKRNNFCKIGQFLCFLFLIFAARESC